MTWVFVVMLWQLVVVGGLIVSRRLRRLERMISPPWEAQVGALREDIWALRDGSASTARVHGRRLREIEASTAQLETAMRVLSKQLDEKFASQPEVARRGKGAA